MPVPCLLGWDPDFAVVLKTFDMNRIRNNEWQNDEELQSSIKHYVMQNLKRSEVLDFLKRDYPGYAPGDMLGAYLRLIDT